MGDILFVPPNINDHVEWVPGDIPEPVLKTTFIKGGALKITMTMWVPKPRIKPGHEKFFGALKQKPPSSLDDEKVK